MGFSMQVALFFTIGALTKIVLIPVRWPSFHGENRVYLDTILSAGDTVIVTPPADSTFNKVVLTFSGASQNFREIEIYGKPINLAPSAEITTTVTGFFP